MRMRGLELGGDGWILWRMARWVDIFEGIWMVIRVMCEIMLESHTDGWILWQIHLWVGIVAFDGIPMVMHVMCRMMTYRDFLICAQGTAKSRLSLDNQHGWLRWPLQCSARSAVSLDHP